MIDPYKAPWRGFTLDPYTVARIFGINDPIIFQALKKILRLGRKHKTLAEDVREAITSLERWERLEAEERGLINQVELPFAEPTAEPYTPPRFAENGSQA